jgi:hypothetical protein
LLNIKNHFKGVGSLTFNHKNKVAFYVVSKLEDLIEIIIPHFNQYPLLTNKRMDFELFKLAVNLMKQRKHLTLEGLQKIVNIKASMNKGLSDVLIKAFPEVKPVLRPLVVNQKNIDPN